MTTRQSSSIPEIQTEFPSSQNVFLLTTLVSLSLPKSSNPFFLHLLLYSYLSLNGVIIMRGYSLCQWVHPHHITSQRGPTFCYWYDPLVTHAWCWAFLGGWIPPRLHLLIMACPGVLDSSARLAPLNSTSGLRCVEAIRSNRSRLSNEWSSSSRQVFCSRSA